MLPIELLLQIIEQLSAPSAAFFPIYYMKIKLLTRTMYLEHLVSRWDDIYAFLDLIARDLADHVVCSPCQKLDELEDSSRYQQSYLRLIITACMCDNANATTVLTSVINFSSAVLSVAMKHHLTKSRLRPTRGITFQMLRRYLPSTNV